MSTQREREEHERVRRYTQAVDSHQTDAAPVIASTLAQSASPQSGATAAAAVVQTKLVRAPKSGHLLRDHGTQLKKANKDLAALWTAATERIQRYDARKGIQ